MKKGNGQTRQPANELDDTDIDYVNDFYCMMLKDGTTRVGFMKGSGKSNPQFESGAIEPKPVFLQGLSPRPEKHWILRAWEKLHFR